MSDRTGIQWTDATWGPVRGCSVVSAGCQNCYATREAIRSVGGANAGFVRSTPAGPKWTGRVELVPERLDQPLRWRRPRRIFVNSLSDLFHEALPDEAIDRVFAVMALAPQHTFQVLTKRPERMRRYFAEARTPLGRAHEVIVQANDRMLACEGSWPGWPLPNVWVGTSVEDQATADERIPILLRTPAAVRFISAEPLLGHINVHRALFAIDEDDDAPQMRSRGVHWIIVGGESGPGARPCDVRWIRSIVAQCREAGTPVFVKQVGAHVVERNDRIANCPDSPDTWPEDTETNVSAPYQGAPCRVLLRDRKGGDMDEWPEDLRVREFPATEATR